MTGGWKAFFLLIPAISLAGARSMNAQTRSSAAVRASNTMVPAYDVAKEVKVQGTIQKIDGFGTSGPIGTHIFIQTAAGTIDVHLGFGAASKPGYLGIAPGQSVTVIGMMETVGSASVLMARILTTPNHIFVLRNEHGFPIRGIPRGRARMKTFFSYAPSIARESSWKTL
ncbi:MAG TPA: hypothetical protein VJR26_07300 [Candidatus Acidoferrales bacterium]|nr:hypothetical protein [Candidatus Acidoferrales bacterium]